RRGAAPPGAGGPALSAGARPRPKRRREPGSPSLSSEQDAQFGGAGCRSTRTAATIRDPKSNINHAIHTGHVVPGDPRMARQTRRVCRTRLRARRTKLVVGILIAAASVVVLAAAAFAQQGSG